MNAGLDEFLRDAENGTQRTALTISYWMLVAEWHQNDDGNRKMAKRLAREAVARAVGGEDLSQVVSTAVDVLRRHDHSNPECVVGLVNCHIIMRECVKHFAQRESTCFPFAYITYYLVPGAQFRKGYMKVRRQRVRHFWINYCGYIIDITPELLRAHGRNVPQYEYLLDDGQQKCSDRRDNPRLLKELDRAYEYVDKVGPRQYYKRDQQMRELIDDCAQKIKDINTSK